MSRPGVATGARKATLRRDNWTCQKCGRRNGVELHCHHVCPRREGGLEVPENLATLCAACHMEWEGLQKVIEVPFERWLRLPTAAALVALLLSDTAWRRPPLAGISGGELRAMLIGGEVSAGLVAIWATEIRPEELDNEDTEDEQANLGRPRKKWRRYRRVQAGDVERVVAMTSEAPDAIKQG